MADFDSELQVKKNRLTWVGMFAVIAAEVFSISFIYWMSVNQIAAGSIISQPIAPIPAAFREESDPVYAAALTSCTSRESKRLAISEEEAEDVCRAVVDASFDRVDHR